MKDECPLIAGKEGEPCQPNGIVCGILCSLIIYTYNLHSLLLLIVADGCPEETDPYYGIAWPSTMVNSNATNNCPNGTGKCFDFSL